MKKRPQEPTEQLNTPAPAVAEPEETYSLEDIMREFGGWTKQPDPEPAPVPEPEPVPVPNPEPEKEAEPKAEESPKPAADVMRVAAETEPQAKPKPSFKLIDLSGDTIPFKAVTDEDLQEAEPEKKGDPVEMPEEPEQPAPDRKQEKAEEKARKRSEQRLRKQEAQRRKAQKQALRAARREEPEVVYPSPEDACAAYAKVGTLRLRLLATFLMTLVSGMLLALTQYPLGSLDLTGSLRPFSVAMLAILLGQCVLSYEVFVRGIYQALSMRFDLMSLLTLAALVSIGDAFFAIPQERAPFCTGISLSLLLALTMLASAWIPPDAENRTVHGEPGGGGEGRKSLAWVGLHFPWGRQPGRFYGHAGNA